MSGDRRACFPNAKQFFEIEKPERFQIGVEQMKKHPFKAMRHHLSGAGNGVKTGRNLLTKQSPNNLTVIWNTQFGKDFMNELGEKLNALARLWTGRGLPSHQSLLETARDLEQWKQKTGCRGLWKKQPLFIATTIDDGIGQGIKIITTYASLAGMRVMHLGLVRKPAVIIEACRENRPDFLGATVLQPDSEPLLVEIGRGLPPETRFIAGGPVFRYDPELAARCGIHAVIKDLAHFILFVLEKCE